MTAPETPQPTTPDSIAARRLTIRVVQVGCLLWLIALTVTLAVPNLRTGSRSWWPSCCALGLILGLLGWGYIARGRGNAARLD